MSNKLSIEIDTGNAAFDEGNGGDEAARILEKLASQLREGYTSGLLYDYNGNRVGSWCVTYPDN